MSPPSSRGFHSLTDAINQARRQRRRNGLTFAPERAPEPEPEPVVLDQPNRNEDYCDWSDLRIESCAHCQGHYLDEALLEASKP